MKEIELEECKCCEWHHEPDDWPVDCRDDSRSYIQGGRRARRKATRRSHYQEA